MRAADNARTFRALVLGADLQPSGDYDGLPKPMAHANARHLRWADLPTDRPLADIERQRVIAEAMMISRVHLSVGFKLASHAHANEQIVVVLSGRCEFGVGEEGSANFRTMVVSAGEVLVLPPWVWHGCTVLEDTVILDLFSPPSEKTGVDRR